MTAEERECYGHDWWGHKQDSDKGGRKMKNVLQVKWQKERGEGITHGYDEKADGTQGKPSEFEQSGVDNRAFGL